MVCQVQEEAQAAEEVQEVDEVQVVQVQGDTEAVHMEASEEVHAADMDIDHQCHRAEVTVWVDMEWDTAHIAEAVAAVDV